MKFRQDINGLRAIAVLAVVLFHFNSSWLPGGFAGVDVFFVISGFLMTGIIFGKIEKNTFSVIDFYIARAKRIIPALTVVCLVVLVFGWFYIAPTDYQTLGKHSLSSLTFTSNFIYWREAGYFDVASKSKWLLHTWSLSAEWQFYILYPIALIGLIKLFSLKTTKYLVLITTIIAFLLSIMTTFKWAEASYFLLPARCWEMMAGGLVYLFPINLKARTQQLLSWFGLTLIAIAYFLFSESDLWPGYLALIPVVGAMLFLMANNESNPLINCTPIQKIGLWSYSIYLWHWVILALIYFFNPFFGIKVQIAGIISSILAGYMSYTLIERKSVKWLNISLFVIAVTLSSTVYLNQGITSPIREQTAQYDTTDWVGMYKDFKDSDMGGDYWVPCASGWQMVYNNHLNVAEKCTKNKGSGGVFLLGDSHAAAMGVGIRNILKSTTPFNQLATPGCAVNWDGIQVKMGVDKFAKGCNYQNSLSKKLITEIKPSVVILVKAIGHEFANYDKLASQIKSTGVNKVLILGPVPQWDPTLPVALTKHKKILGDYLISDYLRQSVIKTNNIIKNRYINNKDVTFIDIINHQCHKVGTDLACKYRPNKTDLITFDYGHPTDAGSNYIATNIIKPFMPKQLIK